MASAELGVAKPERAIFDHALALVGAHARRRRGTSGDTPDVDVAGARAAGLRPVLVARAGAQPAGRSRGGACKGGVPVLNDLRGLPGLVAAGAA